MDLAIVPRITRCANMRFMRKVAMHGGKSVLAMSNMLNVFRVTRWAFTPAALLHTHKGGKEPSSIHDDQGSWNLDGEILPQPPDATLHFRRAFRFFFVLLSICEKSSARNSESIILSDFDRLRDEILA
ncbi:hypothetical protein Tcan_00317 [Toxocara canis]|uniref:Uncharacterized protein n=1 Tax=Toxocara canis TaxID=6265 RepID=A0A0B2UKR7_TOXCA|nr:hypothetical protein Tcan_00317 [Toxocara canis]